MTPDKTAARKAGFARRKAAFAEVDPVPAMETLGRWLDSRAGTVLAGYLAISTEIDPLPVMSAWAERGPVCVPVIDGPDRPLRFRRWTPGCEMVAGPLNTRAPAEGEFLDPDLLIVPLLAYDARGYRLGYGGGFYDRTLEGLRARHAISAAGFAYAAQFTEDLPLEPTDQCLDAVITEQGLMEADTASRLATPATRL